MVNGLSQLLLGGATPLCVWGMIGSLVLFLIELRSAFIPGGENKLRLAVVAFAGGVVLLQRLGRLQGPSVARGYGWFLGLAITFFAAYFAFAYRLPVHPLVVFAVNEALFLILWWVGHRVTDAVSVDSDEAIAAAVDGGILGRRSRKKHSQPVKEPTEALVARMELEAEIRRESAIKTARQTPGQQDAAASDERWARKLPRGHPGRVLLYFSLVAVPLFGLGMIFGGELATQARATMLLFMYLWCTLSLLALSSLNQMRSYYDARQVTMPEGVGLTWLALGLAIVTGALIVAVFMPQPVTLTRDFLRYRVQAVYRGWEAQGESGKGGGASGKKQPWDREVLKQRLAERYKPVDELKDPYLSEVARQSGIEPEAQRVMALSVVARESGSELFDGILRVVLAVALIAAAFAAVITVVVLVTRVRESLNRVRLLGGLKIRSRRRGLQRPQSADALALERFRRLPDPFGGPYSPRDGDALVRYLWEGLLAFCAAAGTPCPAQITPLEFVQGRPEPLAGFEQQARALAELYNYSEFSGHPVPDERMSELRSFWSALQTHADHFFAHAR